MMRWVVAGLGLLLAAACTDTSEPGDQPVEPTAPATETAVLGSAARAIPEFGTDDFDIYLCEMFIDLHNDLRAKPQPIEIVAQERYMSAPNSFLGGDDRLNVVGLVRNTTTQIMSVLVSARRLSASGEDRGTYCMSGDLSLILAGEVVQPGEVLAFSISMSLLEEGEQITLTATGVPLD